jgi:hypothetical protein
MSSTRCPRCQRPLNLPDHLGGGWVRCPACRIPFEAGAGGDLGPRWVLLPLWPWCAVAVFSLLRGLPRLNGSELFWWVVVPAVLLNLALAASDARAYGRARAAARAQGDPAGLLARCGAAHSALGFTWWWLFILAALAWSPRWGSIPWLGVHLVWGCLILAPGVFVSGLALTVGAWSEARRAGGALRYAVAAYDTLATAYNACALAVAIWAFVWAFGGGVPWAPRFFADILGPLAGVITFGQALRLVPALHAVACALVAGWLSAEIIARRVPSGPPDPVAGLAPARRGDVGRAVRESAAVSPTRCPSCRRALALPDHLRACEVRCPACGADFRAAGVGEAGDPATALAGAARGGGHITGSPAPPGESRITSPGERGAGFAGRDLEPAPPGRLGLLDVLAVWLGLLVLLGVWALRPPPGPGGGLCPWVGVFAGVAYLLALVRLIRREVDRPGGRGVP